MTSRIKVRIIANNNVNSITLSKWLHEYLEEHYRVTLVPSSYHHAGLTILCICNNKLLSREQNQAAIDCINLETRLVMTSGPAWLDQMLEPLADYALSKINSTDIMDKHEGEAYTEGYAEHHTDDPEYLEQLVNHY
jgi:hypothetical protein